MLSKEVQELVDKSRKQTDIIKSVDAGMGALRKQNDEMKAKLDAISSQPPVDPGTGAPPVYSLSEEDLAGLREISGNFDTTIDSLKDDIPANVDPMNQPAKQPENTQPAPSSDLPPPVADPATHASDAQAASQAQPLPGTGAPAPDAPADQTAPAEDKPQQM